MFTDDQQKQTEFVKHPYKSTKEFLEETLGPGLIPNSSAETYYQNCLICLNNSKPYLKNSNVNNTHFSQSSVSSESGLSASHHSQTLNINDQHLAAGHTLQSTVYPCSPKKSNLLYKQLLDKNVQHLSTSFNALNPTLPSIKSFQSQVLY